MANNIRTVFIGTELKLNISIENIGDLTMDDYNFDIEVYCSAKRIISINKADAIRIDENNCMVLIDTNNLGAGDVKCRITAYIPDVDFDDSIRTEVICVDAGVSIVKTI